MRLTWILGGGAFGAALSLAIGNSPIGVAVGTLVGGIGGWWAVYLLRP